MDQESGYTVEIKWLNVIVMTILHGLSLSALTMLHQVRFSTIVWETSLYFMAGLGITAGVHRLWSHKSYKAKLPLRILLAIFNSIAIENSILDWARDHRSHHKYSETHADPHNAKRGMFFAHMGWLMVRKHPDVIKNGKKLDLSDLYDDPVVMFQDKYYIPIALTCAILIPTAVPLVWNESLVGSFLLCALRICLVFHITWLVNSLAHSHGNRPYDKSINPAENWPVALITMGEGFHNYHHVFPYDYSTSEYGFRLNPTTAFINFMRLLGLAYDCRKVEPDTVLARRKRTGNLSKSD